MSVPPEDPSEELRRQRLVRELSRDVGKFLLDAARAHPGIWEERDPDAPARAELARLMLQGARRVRLKREAEAAAAPPPPQKPTFTEEELRRRPKYRGGRRPKREGNDAG